MLSNMKSDSRKLERPSLLSKRVLRTNKINSNEAMKLQERLKDMTGRQRQRDKNHAEEVQGIKTNLNQVVNVKEKMEISPLRRKFLQDHGVKLQVRDVYMEDFITAVDNALHKPEKIVFLASNGEEKTINSEYGSMPDLRITESSKAVSRSSNYSDGSFPLHLPINFLRKKTKSKLSKDISLSVESLADEDDASSEYVSGARSSRPSSTKSNRPTSGKSQNNFQFRVISPPLKGRHIVEVYKDMEEEEKLVKKLLEKKKFHDRLKKEEALKKKSLRPMTSAKGKSVSCERSESSFKIGVEQTSDVEIDGDSDHEIVEVGSAAVNFKDGNEEFARKVMEKSDDQTISVLAHETSPKSDIDDEFEKLMQKSLKLTLERKHKAVTEKAHSAAEGSNFTVNAIRPEQSFVDSEKIEKMSKNASRNQKQLRVSLPDEEYKSSENIEEFYSVEQNSKSSKSSFDIEKWNNLVSKIRGELQEQKSTRPVIGKRAFSPKGRISKISHPTAVDMDEDIIYDARPEKSVAKGYATMHMTVGKRSVSICVPRFKNEGVCKEQTATRAHAKSEMNVEQVREKKQAKKKRAVSFD